MTCEPTYIMMGMSAETFWGGLRAMPNSRPGCGKTSGRRWADQRRGRAQGRARRVRRQDGCGADALSTGGRRAGPAFLEESGYTVTNVVGLKCDSATSLAHTPPREVIDAVLNELDGDNVDAIVQAGTNLSTQDIFPALEQQLGKPVIPINIATIWHAFRAHGIADKIFGRGWLLERF
jgi:maleate isomerase